MSTSMATTPTTTRAVAPAPARTPAPPRQCCGHHLLLLAPSTTTSHRRRGSSAVARSAKKKNPWLDPFDDGPDEEFDYQGMFSGGKQEEDPRPPEDPTNPFGFLRFPQGYNPELDSLASKVRGDVRRACCVVSGGVYENVLFFPVVQMLKDRYPGVLVDVVTSERGKQVYEMCKNVRYANVYDPDDDWPEPAEYTHQLGVLKNRYYDLILSTRLAGIGHALFLFMSSARDKVGYIYPNVNSVGAGLFLTEMFKAPTTNLSDGGYHIETRSVRYKEMLEWIGRPAKNVPRQPTQPLRVSISKKLRAYVEDKYSRAGVEKGKYVVIHGIASDSVANMKSRGDDDCLLPLEHWAQIAKEIRFTLTCLINDSAGVVATNTAAVQLANARDKPCVALFSSAEKAKLFLPYVEDKGSCTVITSATGKLIDIDVEAVKKAVKDFVPAPTFALA
ncbi:hypothetical protein HU200_066521 [Digitaria exilis]|uniref:Photosynthetic NDH subunit of subcomplex B 1, chloroplastic n=1 Tax=Digitaria exilis TaxID=1010633 RepID=A0A835DSU6_9POAL|nr:hypothetical protein HU200_066521 [Digitaria exilis]